MFLFSSKGQEGAPFELLIAVILMTFVLFVGLQAMEFLSQQQCFNKADAKLEELKRALEEVITLKGTQTIDFRFEACTQEEQEKVIIKNVEDNFVCRNVCGVNRDQCTLILWENTTNPIQKCLQGIPSYVHYVTTTEECGITDSDAFELIELDSDIGIPKGFYVLKFYKYSGQTPKVCAIRRKT
jgi:hypothetical protein